MIETGSRRTPPYNDADIKNSIQTVKADVAALKDQVDHMDVSDQVKEDIIVLQQKVQVLENSLGGENGATDSQIQAIKADVDSFGRVLDAHVQDAEKHVSSTDRANWNGFGTSIQKVQSDLSTHMANSIPHITAAERTKWNNTTEETATNTSDIQTIKLDIQDIGGVLDHAQTYGLTDTNGVRKRLPDGSDLLKAAPGFYYGDGSKITNNPVTGSDAGWFNYDILGGVSGRRDIRASKSFTGEEWYLSVYTNGVVANGWRKIITDLDWNNLFWMDVVLKNGATHGSQPLQYAKWGRVLALRGRVKCDRDIDIGQIPSTDAPDVEKAWNCTVMGTTGLSKAYLKTNGVIRISGIMANSESNIAEYNLDQLFLV